MIDQLIIEIERLQKRVSDLELGEAGPIWTFLSTPLTSTSWDGDAKSTTAKTKIDLSAVFGTPALIKAVLMRVVIQDSGASSTDCWLMLAPNDTAASGVGMRCLPADDRYADQSLVVPCNSDGDVYYQINASGSGTMDVFLQVWGYCK